MMRLLTVCILFAGLLSLACTTGLTPAGPQTAYDFSAIDQIMRDSVSTIYNGNAVIMITIDGKPVYVRSYGNLTPTTRRPIASNSKWLTGAVMLSLVDEGKLSLSDTVGRYLPVFSRYGKGGITIRQLLSHTSGFPGNSEQRYELIRYRNSTLAAIADSIALRVPLKYKPGSTFEYGGVSMQVAGRIAEVVSGKAWEALFQEKIAGPCQMRDTDYGQMTNPALAGSVRSTAGDYTNFLIMLVNGGVFNGKRVLSAQSVLAMQQNQSGNVVIGHSPYPAKPPFNPYHNDIIRYGIGCWRDVVAPGDQAEEVSSPGLFGAHPWIVPSKKLTGYIFTFQLNAGYTLSRATSLRIRSLVREAVK